MPITVPQMSGSIPRFAAMMFMPRVQLIGNVGLKPRPPGSSSVPKSGDDASSCGATPGSRGTKIEIRSTTPRMIAAPDHPAPDMFAERGGPAAGAQPERHRDALEPDQEVVPGDEDAERDRHDRNVQGVELRELLGGRRDRQQAVGGVAEGAREPNRVEDLADVPGYAETDLVPVQRLARQRDHEREPGQPDADEPQALLAPR